MSLEESPLYLIPMIEVPCHLLYMILDWDGGKPPPLGETASGFPPSTISNESDPFHPKGEAT